MPVTLQTVLRSPNVVTKISENHSASIWRRRRHILPKIVSTRHSVISLYNVFLKRSSDPLSLRNTPIRPAVKITVHPSARKFLNCLFKTKTKVHVKCGAYHYGLHLRFCCRQIHICHFIIYNRPEVAFRICLLRVPQYGNKERINKEAKCSLLAGNPSSVRISYLIHKSTVCVCYHYLSNFPAVCWFSVHRPQQPATLLPF